MRNSEYPRPRRLEFRQERFIYLPMNSTILLRNLLHQVVGQLDIPSPNRLDDENSALRYPKTIIFSQVLLLCFGFSDLDSTLSFQLAGSSRKKDLAA